MDPAEAKAAARRKLGNASLIREEVYEMNTLTFLEGLLRDARHALRMLPDATKPRPVKSFNYMTEIVLVGSFKNMTKRPSVFSVLVICKSPPGSRPSGGPRPMRRTGSEVIGGPLEITLERAFFPPSLW